MKFYTETEYLQKRIETLEKQLAEKDAMIDWFAGMCEDFCAYHHYCNECIHYPTSCPIVELIKNRFCKYEVPDWCKAAQAAVKKR